jgi:hypothetical protein
MNNQGVNNTIIQYLIVSLLGLLVAQHVLNINVKQTLTNLLEKGRTFILSLLTPNQPTNGRSDLLNYMNESLPESEGNILQATLPTLNEEGDSTVIDDRQYNSEQCVLPPLTQDTKTLEEQCNEKDLLGHNDYYKGTVIDKCIMKGTYLGEVKPYDDKGGKFRPL